VLPSKVKQFAPNTINKEDADPEGKLNRNGSKGTNTLNDTHYSVDDYASFVLGALDSPDKDQLLAHLHDHCEVCRQELREAGGFWYVFAALTERTQDMAFPEPAPMLRDRVLGIARRSRRPVTEMPRVQIWLRIAAGILVTAGAASLSWNVGRYEIKKDISAAQARVERESAAVKKLESENNALRNLVKAARNAPAVFPGRDASVSVQDPAADARREERSKSASLEKRLSQTTQLLAAATHDKEESDRQYRKASDAAMAEKEQSASRFSAEIATFHSKIQDLEKQHSQMISLLQSRNVSLVQLHATGASPAASGVAIIADDQRLVFFPANLPGAPAGRTYQLWLLRDKGPAMVSAGTFNAGANGLPNLQLNNKLLLAGVKGLTVTEEKAGGSQQPVGQKILTGTIQSTVR
jgi:Anti-sigma-K factor rskA